MVKSNTRIRAERLDASRSIATHLEVQWVDLLEEVDGLCVRCGDTDIRMQKDHVRPIYSGGSDGIDNLQPLCRGCNLQKGPEAIHWLNLWRDAGSPRPWAGFPQCKNLGARGKRLAMANAAIRALG